MATWEEMITGTYNPVNTVNERHQALIEQRKAANMQRMQAANPGFQAGGYGNQAPMNFGGPTDFGGPVQYDPLAPRALAQFQPLPQPQATTSRPPTQFNPQGVTPFGSPSVMDNQDEWLKSQIDLAGEHLGGIGDPSQAAAVAAQAGGPIGGGQGGASDGPNSGGVNSGRTPDALDDAANALNGLTPEQAGWINALIGPLAVPITKSMTMNDNMIDALEGYDTFRAAFPDTVVDINALPESNVFDLDPTAAPGVGLGLSTNSGMGMMGIGPQGGTDNSGLSTDSGMGMSGIGPQGGTDNSGGLSSDSGMGSSGVGPQGGTDNSSSSSSGSSSAGSSSGGGNSGGSGGDGVGGGGEGGPNSAK